MKIMKQLGVVMVAVLMLIGATAPVRAESYGTLVGNVVATVAYSGPAGYVNTIELVFDTNDGIWWSLRCRRADANLGLCSNLTAGTYHATGVFASNTVMDLQTMNH